MTLQEIQVLQAYGVWATRRIFEALGGLPDDEYKRDLKGSHGGIHPTLVHLVGAERVWLERFKGGPLSPFLKAEEIATRAELQTIWERNRAATEEWLATLSDEALQQSFTMKTTKGETFTHAYWQAFQHLANHSTYHRGQVVTMMRQLGAEPPGTDLITYYRETATA
jgi:uncharacterized damage-inducible protein DinB